MKPHYRAMIGGLVALAVASLLHGQDAAGRSSPAGPGSPVRGAMTRLIREDAEKARSARQHDAEQKSETAEEVVVLEPLVVTDEKPLPEFAMPRENRLQEVLRTGTIKEYVGKKTTVRLWTSGDAGLVLSFRW